MIEQRERTNSPYINHFLSPDSIIPDQTNPQNWDRYAYVTNNPIRLTDPTGHRPCDDEFGCNPPPPKQPIWSTAKYKNERLSNSLSNLSTRLQHAANFFSYIGAFNEIAFTTAGLLGGGSAVGWVDLGSPVADVSGGLAGGLVGWEVGHGLHLLVTNPLESSLSSASTATTYLSDIANGNTRIDVYKANITVVVGQSTATSAALTLAGNASTVGVADAAIDQIGSSYSDGKIGGIYDLLGITGNSFSVSTMMPFFNFQFGD